MPHYVSILSHEHRLVSVSLVWQSRGIRESILRMSLYFLLDLFSQNRHQYDICASVVNLSQSNFAYECRTTVARQVRSDFVTDSR